MSAVTDVFDSLNERISTILGVGWNELPHAYKVDENPALLLKQGFGLAAGPATNERKLQSRMLSLKRKFKVTLSRSIDATEFAVSGKQTTAKQLLEDLRSIVADLELNSEYNGVQILATFDDDSGIQTVDAEKENFLFIEGNFSVEYFDKF